MNTLMQDIRFALRQLRKSPGFMLTAVVTLALCIGANATIFSLVHAVLLRNLPVHDPKMLVRVGDTDDCCVNGGNPENSDYSIFAYDGYRDLQAKTPEFEQLAAMQAGFGYPSVTARSNKLGDLPRPVVGELVSGNYFQVFGIAPSAGRFFNPSDDNETAAPVAVMSYAAWQHKYAGDPSVVGSTFTLNTHPVTIVGIGPKGFYGDRLTDAPPDFWYPFSMEPVLGTWTPSLLRRHESNWVYIVGRIRPGVDLKSLQAKMSVTLRQWLAPIETYQKAGTERDLAAAHVVLTPGNGGIQNLRQQSGSGLTLLMAISALVLLIGCANIANLVLVRGMARRSEVALRIALGAPRKRIIVQMVTESIVLSCLGGLAGLLLSVAGTRALLALAFPNSPDLPIDATPSFVVLAFAFGVSLITGLLFGVAPAWITSRADAAEALRGANRTSGSGASPLQKALVILQAMLSLVLLVGAGLLSKSLGRLEHQDFGVQPENRVVVHISPNNAGYKPETLSVLNDRIIEELERIPGVSAAGLALYTPLEGNNWGERVSIQGQPEGNPHDDNGASWLRVGPKFFDIIGQTLRRGRGITDKDTATSPGVAVVNEAFVKKFFTHGEDPIGMHFGTSGSKSTADFEIVGVVKNVKYNNVTRPVRAMYFRPFGQIELTDPKSDLASLYPGAIMIQTKAQVPGLEAQVRQALANINSNLTVIRYRTFEDQIAGQFTNERLVARLTLMFGLLALILASIGLYGVTAYTVARRTSEIGIRMALGADRNNVVGMVLRSAMLQAGIGLAIGIPVTLLCVRYIKSQLYDVSGYDLGVLAGATVTLAIAACIAGLIPARRAASTDPMRALRTE
jgi:macrolide transport system ATP-binding/permease protein